MTPAKPDTSSPGICLLTPADLTPELMAGAVVPALGHSSAEVIIVTASTQKNAAAGLVRELRDLTRRLGKVFLVENGIGLARELAADGVLVDAVDDIGRAKAEIGDGAMVGVVCGLSRHMAMEAGEAGADFIGLDGEGEDMDGTEKLAEHIAWWSQLFEVPSVAFGAEKPEDGEVFLAAGTDFLALGDPFWSTTDMTGLVDRLIDPYAFATGAGRK